MIHELPKRVSSPEYRITCAEEEKATIVDHVKNLFAQRTDAQLLTIDGLRATTPYGWGLIRASNTQAVICLRFESNTKKGLEQIQADFAQALTPFFTDEMLQGYFVD